jgi:hypothetical protein
MALRRCGSAPDFSGPRARTRGRWREAARLRTETGISGSAVTACGHERSARRSRGASEPKGRQRQSCACGSTARLTARRCSTGGSAESVSASPSVRWPASQARESRPPTTRGRRPRRPSRPGLFWSAPPSRRLGRPRRPSRPGLFWSAPPSRRLGRPRRPSRPGLFWSAAPWSAPSIRRADRGARRSSRGGGRRAHRGAPARAGSRSPGRDRGD